MRALITESLPGDPRLLVFLVLFVVAFAAVVAWQWRPATRRAQADLAQLPLHDAE